MSELPPCPYEDCVTPGHHYHYRHWNDAEWVSSGLIKPGIHDEQECRRAGLRSTVCYGPGPKAEVEPCLHTRVVCHCRDCGKEVQGMR